MTRRYAASRTIDAPVRAVWDLLKDVDSYPTWNSTVLEAQGSATEGGTISLVSTVSPQRTFTLTVAEVSAPHRMVWTDGMPLGLFRGTRTYTVTERGRGARFEMVEEFSGPLSPLMAKVIPDLAPSFEEFAESVKAAAEAD